MISQAQGTSGLAKFLALREAAAPDLEISRSCDEADLLEAKLFGQKLGQK